MHSESYTRPAVLVGKELGRTGQLKEEDIIIAHFIDTLVGQDGHRAGHKLNSCTEKIRATRVQRHPEKGDRIILVDTPGFESSDKSDMEILKIIADWLEKTYKKKIKVTGIVYLHRISENRMTRSLNFRVFEELCGEEAAKRVVLATSMWDEVRDKQVGKERLKELEDNTWKSMLEAGARSIRFDKTPQSAWEIIDSFFLEEDDPERLRIQEELVDLKKRLYETRAALAMHTGTKRVENTGLLAERDKQGTKKSSAQLKAEYKTAEEEMNRIHEEMKRMKIPTTTERFAALFKGKKWFGTTA